MLGDNKYKDRILNFYYFVNVITNAMMFNVNTYYYLSVKGNFSALYGTCTYILYPMYYKNSYIIIEMYYSNK